MDALSNLKKFQKYQQKISKNKQNNKSNQSQILYHLNPQKINPLLNNFRQDTYPHTKWLHLLFKTIKNRNQTQNRKSWKAKKYLIHRIKDYGKEIILIGIAREAMYKVRNRVLEVSLGLEKEVRKKMGRIFVITEMILWSLLKNCREWSKKAVELQITNSSNKE